MAGCVVAWLMVIGELGVEWGDYRLFQNGTNSKLTPRRIHQNKRLRQRTVRPHPREPPLLLFRRSNSCRVSSGRASPRQRMPLAPPFGQHLGDVVRVQIQVHAVVRVVDMHNLAVAAHVDRMARKQREAVLLETTRRRAEFLRVLRGEARQGGFERDKGGRGSVLVELALRGEACDRGAGTGAVREVALAGEDSGLGPGERGTGW